MDIAALSTSMAQASTNQMVSLAVTKLAINTSVQQTSDLTQMMEQSVSPNLGKNIDFRV